jgi:hypothetical protein
MRQEGGNFSNREGAMPRVKKAYHEMRYFRGNELFVREWAIFQVALITSWASSSAKTFSLSLQSQVSIRLICILFFVSLSLIWPRTSHSTRRRLTLKEEQRRNISERRPAFKWYHSEEGESLDLCLVACDFPPPQGSTSYYKLDFNLAHTIQSAKCNCRSEKREYGSIGIISRLERYRLCVALRIFTRACTAIVHTAFSFLVACTPTPQIVTMIWKAKISICWRIDGLIGDDGQWLGVALVLPGYTRTVQWKEGALSLFRSLHTFFFWPWLQNSTNVF